jgi:hypothetical protein
MPCSKRGRNEENKVFVADVQVGFRYADAADLVGSDYEGGVRQDCRVAGEMVGPKACLYLRKAYGDHEMTDNGRPYQENEAGPSIEQLIVACEKYSTEKPGCQFRLSFMRPDGCSEAHWLAYFCVPEDNLPVHPVLSSHTERAATLKDALVKLVKACGI